MKGLNRGEIGSQPRLQNFWDMRAACNFMGGGSGAGLLIASAVIATLELPYLTPVLLGMALVGFGLIMVWLEIGKPWRALHVFLHPQTSWMTREGITAQFLLGAAAASVIFYDSPWGVGAAVLAGFLAVAYLYCQSQMLFASKGIPTWRHPALTPYVMATGLTEGLGMAVCLLVMSADFRIEALLLAALVARAYTWRSYVAALHRDGAPSASLAALDKFNRPLLALGHLIPVVLIGVAWLADSLQAIAVVAAGLLAASVGAYSKIIIVTRAAHTQGFAIPITPVRGRGTSRPAKSPGWPDSAKNGS